VKIAFGALLLAIACGPALAGPSASATAIGHRPRAVVELFTSQGCANCPPADAFLSELARDPDLVTLSFPVDYWDYLGWKDTAAKPEFTQRQRAYATRRGDHDVYTPQMVIDGRAHLVGSDRAAVAREIGTTGAPSTRLPVPVDLETSNDAIVVSVGTPGDEPTAQTATVWLVRYDVERTVPVRRGENTGRSLTYAHLVRSIQPVGMWKGRPLRIELPRQDIVADDGSGCAVLVQTDHDGIPGPILGARVLQSSPRS